MYHSSAQLSIKYKIDLVLIPFNILDQRILYSGWLNILKKNKVLIFSRSCFLQGLLLSNYKFYRRFNKFYKILDKFSNWCKTNRISKLEACLSFVKKIKKIDYLIVGFNNYYQFKEILTDTVIEFKAAFLASILINS